MLVYPRIANFDDFDPLRLEPGVDLVFLGPGEPVPGDTALVILPGSKATIADLASLREAGWDIDLRAHRAARRLTSWESAAATRCWAAASPIRTASRDRPAKVEGLGLLEVDTILEGDKVLVEVTGETVGSGVPFKGYEMHVGRTTGAVQPLLKLANGQVDGAVSADGRVAGCYIHGLLADDRQRQHWLQRVGGQASSFAYESDVDATLDLLADHLEKHVDCDRLLALAREPRVRA